MPTPYTLINNGDTGLSARTTINAILTDANNGLFIGATGAAGSSGTSGSSGTNGAAGSSGTSGSSGGGGGSATQSTIESQISAVWRTSGSFTNQDGGWILTGGLYTDYPQGTLTLIANGLYISTVYIGDGEKLEAIRWRVPTYTATTTVDIGLYSISRSDVFQNNATYSAFRIGNLLHTITTGLSITSSGEFQINNINYTANKANTFHNLYAIVYRPSAASAAGHLLRRPGSQILIPHIGGGIDSGGLYYRQFALYAGTASSLPADMSSNVITPDTSGGAVFTIRKTTP